MIHCVSPLELLILSEDKKEQAREKKRKEVTRIKSIEEHLKSGRRQHHVADNPALKITAEIWNISGAFQWRSRPKLHQQPRPHQSMRRPNQVRNQGL